MLDAWSNPWFFLFVLFFFFFFIFSSKSHLFVTADTISTGQSLTGDQKIVSKGENFVLGFFTPGKSLNYYIGIWYNMNKVTVQTVVWVANRENPLKDPSSSELKLIENGNLVLLDESKITIWSTNSTSNASNSSEVILGDDGNLVLRNGLDKSDIIWQSFDYPTDTLLPGGKLSFNKLTNKSMQLTSWKNSENPAKGFFSMELDPGGTNQFFIQWNESKRYWSSGPWNEHVFINVPEMRTYYMYNFSYITNENENYFTYNLYNNSIISRCVLDLSGQVQQSSWLPESKEWILVWSKPKLKCDVYAICGPFGSCDEANSNYCQCLEGFKPRSKDWYLSDRSLGCVKCGDGFQYNPNMKLPINGLSLEVGSAEECKLACLNMSDCSCNAYSYLKGRCLVWSGDLLNVQNSSNGDIGGEDLYIRLPTSELWNFGGKKKRPSNTWVIVGAVAGTFALLGLVLTLIWRWRTRRSIGTSKKVEDSLVLSRWRKKRKGMERKIEDLFDVSGTTKNCKDTTEAEIPIEGSKQGNAPHLALLDFEAIANATNNFSDANKLGMGGFGHVYKGMLPGGQVIAVKRLSKSSGQGLKEFKNEVTLISKLQHRNLVRLLGCCIEGEEKMLIYEYMPNKSLDSFLFDPTKQVQLNWPKRFHIVEGIARGLLYLHRDSRLKIIHRDLKAGNILLDDEMNPKISDFGMARIFGGNQTLANTNRVVGTYGYMSPEYAMEGKFSEKSDVFSFGVLLLEVVSGKRINQCYLHENSLNLVGFAWRLWNEGKEMELMDPTLRESHSASEVLRCIHVGLLCVQEHAAERPTMSNIVQMLVMDTTQLPTPRQPGFTIESDLSLASQEMCSICNVTITEESGR